MQVDLSSASGFTLDGMGGMGGSIYAGVHNITIRNSTFTTDMVVDGPTNASITFDHDSFPCGSCEPARLHLAYGQSTPSGVTVSNSVFAGGDSDGIQTGVGMNIIHNEFRDILESGPNHTDNIQLIGAAGSVVRGNWVHNTVSGSTQGITAFNGLANAIIEDNVIDLSGADMRPWGLELQTDSGSIVRHNTLVYRGICVYNLPCGLIAIRTGSVNTTVMDNIAARIDVLDGSTLAAHGHNMVQNGAMSGDFLGVPTFAGGTHPATYAGYALTTSSPGKNAASDGLDVGARLS
jgi:hypothetical protein